MFFWYNYSMNKQDGIISQYGEEEVKDLLNSKPLSELKLLFNCSRKVIDNLRNRFNIIPFRNLYEKILLDYEGIENTLVELLTKLQRKELYKKLDCSQKVVDKLIKHFDIKRNASETSNHKWRQILTQYKDKQELIKLLKNTSYVELAVHWNCAVDCVYTLRKRLGIGQKRTDVEKFLKEYTKEVLEDLYFNTYDRRLWKMADTLDIYQDTLSQIFKNLGIEQQPHTIEEARTFITFTETSIERALQEELKSLNINFEIQKRIKGIGTPDIFITPNICIFADGCFYHFCQACFEKTTSKSKLNLSVRKNPETDKRINEKLQKAGYKVFRFWEHDIKKNSQVCIQQVVDYLNSLKG